MKVSENIPSKTESIQQIQHIAAKDAIIRAGQIHANNFAGAGIVTDGIRGNATLKAGIKVLQTAMNLDYKAKLAVDGIYGSATKAALGKHYVKRARNSTWLLHCRFCLCLKDMRVISHVRGYLTQLQNQ